VQNVEFLSVKRVGARKQ